MNVRNSMLAVALAGTFALPVYAERVVIDVHTAPPAPRYEHLPPRAGYVVVPGYYRYDSHRHAHVWVKGGYQRARRGEHYVASEWREHDGRYHFYPGRWERDNRG